MRAAMTFTLPRSSLSLMLRAVGDDLIVLDPDCIMLSIGLEHAGRCHAALYTQPAKALRFHVGSMWAACIAGGPHAAHMESQGFCWLGIYKSISLLTWRQFSVQDLMEAIVGSSWM